jgi:hypothetical protein
MINRVTGSAAIALVLAACGDSTPMGDRASPGTGTPGTPTFSGFKAEAAMISNVGVYRGHEFIYQDYIHDDHGANTDGIDHFDAPLGTPGPDPANPTNPRLSPAPITNNAGDFLYAAADSHMDDVADLIEFRVGADATDVHYRIRLSTLPTADAAVVAICVDEDLELSNGLTEWPFGAGFGQQLGCEHLYTVFGSGARITDAGGHTADLVEAGGAVSADTDESLIHVRVPKSIADPGLKTWRYFVASGLWGGDAWVAPTPIPAISGLPITSGGRLGAPNIWDLLSNNHEPNSTWSEEKQANDLIAHNILDDYVDVDFARLAQDGDDPDPQIVGVSERIYRSQHPTSTGRGTDLDGTNLIYQGPWQPYVLVLPHDYYDDPDRQFPFDLCMHPLGANHNVEVYYSEAFARPDYNPLVTGVFPSTGYFGFSQITALIDRLGAVYACTLGRGEGVGYQGGDGLVDMLEVEADVLRRHRIDLDKRTIHGVSLGALGTWYAARLYPDRYAAAMPYIFTSDIAGGIEDNPLLLNLYNLPVFYSIGTLDQFGQGTQGDLLADQLEGFGDEYVYLHYILRQHEGRIEQDFLPFVNALAYSRALVRDPPRVRFRFDPSVYSEKIPGEGGAYWVSGMTLRDESTGAAEVDVISLARADQLPRHQVIFDGLYLNTAKLYVGRIRGLFRLSEEEFAAMWQPAVWEPNWSPLSLDVTPTDLQVRDVANSFELTATNLAAVSLDPQRMALDAAAPISYTVHTDGPLEIQVGDKHLSLPGAGDFSGTL